MEHVWYSDTAINIIDEKWKIHTVNILIFFNVNKAS
jgi:hypothetical protein